MSTGRTYTRGPEPQEEASGDEETPSADGARFDYVAHQESARRRRKSLRSLPGLIRRGVAVARKASPRLFAASIVLQLLVAALLGAQVLLGKAALEDLLRADAGDGTFASAFPTLVLLLAATAVSSLASSTLTQVQRVLGDRVVRETWRSIFDVTTSVNLATFESPSFFDDLQRVQANALLRPLTLVQGLTQLTGGVVAVVGLSVALLSIAPVLLPVLLLAGLPLALLSRINGRLEFAFSVAQTTSLRLRVYLVELLTVRENAKEVRAFDLGGHLRERWEDAYRLYLADLRKHVLRLLAVVSLGSLASTVVLASALGLIVYLVLEDDLSLAAAGAGIIAARLLSSRVESIFRGIAGIFESALYLEDLETFQRRMPPRGELVGTAARSEPLETLEVDHVSFAYPEGDRPALDGVSVQLRKGQVVALVGENGSGKTTLAKLIAGLYEPSAGAIRWNGRDTTEMVRTGRRPDVGVIFQDFVRYALSAGDNVVLGDIDRGQDAEAVARASARAGAAAFIERLPAGYDTMLGRVFGGLDLSVGQWQRIAIARAFYRDASLLILDEPTSALDPRAEADLFDRIHELAGGRTVLLISHRFSTVRSADQILVLDDGRLIESGTHEELLAARGRYAELFELQAVAYR